MISSTDVATISAPAISDRNKTQSMTKTVSTIVAKVFPLPYYGLKELPGSVEADLERIIKSVLG